MKDPQRCGSFNVSLTHFIVDLILEGPEDDPAGVETCRPNTPIY